MRSRAVIASAVAFAALAACLALSGCTQASSASSQSAGVTDRSNQKTEASSISTNTEYSSTVDGEHAIEVSGGSADYTAAKITKSGDSSGDEADFYGENAAVFATDGATLKVSDSVLTSNGTHANGIFSYGTGSVVNVSHTVINTTGNCSGGLMTTGGGTMNADNVTAETTGNSSAAIRSDRGGGTVKVTGGYFTTSGKGSPAIYSTADITVSEAYLKSTSSQGVVVEGKNSVTLNDCQLMADNNSKNSDKSDTYQAVMIYQSMSGDASVGLSSFAMNGGSLENANGDVFFVNNTSCNIDLSKAAIVNNDASGVFLRAQAAGWGTSGSNGGKVNLNAIAQTIDGIIVVDSVSTLNAYLKEGSAFTGAINTTGQAGNVYVELDENSTWTLTEDSYISGLTCKKGAVNLNGHKLYIDGKVYDGSDSAGTAFEVATATNGAGGEGGVPGGGDKPDGMGGEGGIGGDKPDGVPGGDAGAGGAGGTKPDAAPAKP